MRNRFDPKTLAAALAVSAVALAGSAHAQQGQPQGKQGMQQQAQQRGSQAQQAPMEYRQVRGTVVDAKRVKLRGNSMKTTLVLLDTGQGNRAVVDLGTERLGIQLRQGAQIAVRGRPVNIGNQRVILQANAVNYEGRTLDTNRPAKAQAMGQGQGNRQAMAQGGQQGGKSGGQGMAASLDANNDGKLGRGEVANGLFTRFDQNGDGTLSITEWDRGMDRMFGEDGQFQVSAWDRNGDKIIGRKEFKQGMRQAGLFGRLDNDGNGTLSMAEFRKAGTIGAADNATRSAGAEYDEVAMGLYDRFDRNNDNRLTRTEYRNQANGYFGGEDYFAEWDADSSGWLGDEEFVGGINDAGLFDDWDANADGFVGADEWTAAGYGGDGLFGDNGVFGGDAGMLGDNDSLVGEDPGVL